MKQSFQFHNHTLVFTKEGSGNHRLLFMHGLCGVKELWSKQSVFFKEQFEVVCVDLLGHGESSAVEGDKLLSSNFEILREFLKIYPKPTTLIGHSIGGFLVNDLVGCADNYFFVDSSCLANKDKLEVYHNYSKKILQQTDPASFFREWFSIFVTDKATTAEKQLIIGEAVRRDPKWMAGVMGSIASPQKQTVNESRVFIMEGAQYFGAENLMSWSQLYPQAQKWHYSGLGHFFFLEDPESFNKKILEFLN